MGISLVTSRRCPLLATFLSVLLCLLFLLISDSRFDLVWFRLSCEHGWIHSGSQQQQQQQHRTLSIKGSVGYSRCTDLHALLNNFEDRFFCAYGLLLYKGVIVGALNLGRDQKSFATTGGRWKIP